MPAHEKGVIIGKGAVKDGAHLRARDVEFELRDTNVDPRVKSLLCRLAETNHFLMSNQAQLATAVDQLIDIVQQFSDIAGNMKDKMELIHKDMRGADVDESIATQD